MVLFSHIRKILYNIVKQCNAKYLASSLHFYAELNLSEILFWVDSHWDKIDVSPDRSLYLWTCVLGSFWRDLSSFTLRRRVTSLVREAVGPSSTEPSIITSQWPSSASPSRSVDRRPSAVTQVLWGSLLSSACMVFTYFSVGRVVMGECLVSFINKLKLLTNRITQRAGLCSLSDSKVHLALPMDLQQT